MQQVFLRILFLIGIGSWCAWSQTVIHVDVKKGSDDSNGSAEKPFQTIFQATRAIPLTQTKPFKIRIHPGTYTLDKKIPLDRGQFTAGSRLTIEASLLPDHPDWTPAKMPIIRSIEHPGVVEGRGKTIYGFSVEISHVSIRGIRFSGNPAIGHRYYPIRRDKHKLEDLVVSKCLFEGDREKAPIHVAIIARGHGMVVDHCIFKVYRDPGWVKRQMGFLV